MVQNALADILTRDYEIDVDISTSLKPNKERKKKELIEFVTWLTSPNTMQFLMLHQLTVSPDAIKKAAKEWGWNPETLLISMQPAPPEGAEGLPPEEIPIQGAV